MLLFGKDTTQRPVIVAEVGANHEGSRDKAAELIIMAHEAGADAVKIQSWTAERYASANDPERLERVRAFGLSHDDHTWLFDLAKREGIMLLSTPVSDDWTSTLFALAPAVKIASGDLTFDSMLTDIAEQTSVTKKPVILSTGMATLEEIDHAVAIFSDRLGDRLPDHLALLHCVSGYPTELEDANLRTIPFLKERYGLTTGWSNHVIGAHACIAALALGAEILEVHITDHREGKTFRDHHLSMNREELQDLVKAVEALASGGLGTFAKQPAPVEMGNRIAARKGIIAARDLPAGHTITAEDLAFARPASEFLANEHPHLLGARLTQAVSKGFLIPRAAIRQPAP